MSASRAQDNIVRQRRRARNAPAGALKACTVRVLRPGCRGAVAPKVKRVLRMIRPLRIPRALRSKRVMLYLRMRAAPTRTNHHQLCCSRTPWRRLRQSQVASQAALERLRQRMPHCLESSRPLRISRWLQRLSQSTANVPPGTHSACTPRLRVVMSLTKTAWRMTIHSKTNSQPGGMTTQT